MKKKESVSLSLEKSGYIECIGAITASVLYMMNTFFHGNLSDKLFT